MWLGLKLTWNKSAREKYPELKYWQQIVSGDKSYNELKLLGIKVTKNKSDWEYMRLRNKSDWDKK